MKDQKLGTSWENYAAFDIIAGSSYGGHTDRDIAYDMAVFFSGSINDHQDYSTIIRETAKCPDDELCDHQEWMVQYFDDLYLVPFTHFMWRDNEFICIPSVEYAISDLRQENAVGDELPESYGDGGLYLVINDHGNASLYEWQTSAIKPSEWIEIWSVV